MVSGGTVDTNVILRLLLNDVPAQASKAQKLIEGSKLLRVSLLSIAEVVFVLEGLGYARADVKKNIETLLSIRNLYTKKDVVLPAIELYAKRSTLSFIDACLVFESESLAASPLRTFDKKLAKQASHTKLIA